MTSVAGFLRLDKGEVVLTAASWDSGDVEGEGLMALCRVDGILRRVGGDVVEGGEGPCLDVGHGLRQAGRRRGRRRKEGGIEGWRE